jgi:hypothetical protein
VDMVGLARRRAGADGARLRTEQTWSDAERWVTELSRKLSTLSVSDCSNMVRSLVGNARRSVDVEEILALEERVFLGPVQSAADAIAKLRAVERSLADGGRSDGVDQQALVLVVRWLEANA